MKEHCEKVFNTFTQNYLWVLGIMGFVCNLAGIGVFIKLLRTKNFNKDLYKLSLFQAIADAYFSFSITTFNFSKSKQLKQTYNYLMFELICLRYGHYLVQTLSVILEIIICFFRYKELTKRFAIINKIPLSVIMLVLILLSFSFSIFKLIERQVFPKQSIINGTNLTWSNQSTNNSYNINSNVFYELKYTDFRWSTFGIVMRFVNSFVKDGVCVLVIWILNGLLIFKMRELMNNKKKLFENNKVALKKNERVENKLTVMVISKGIFTSIGHFLTFIYYLPKPETDSDKCFEMSTFLIYDLAFFFAFFFYYFFDKNFSKTFNSLFVCMQNSLLKFRLRLCNINK